MEVRPPIEAADLVAIIADIVARDESDERSPTERDIGTGAETEREIEARVIELGFDTPDGSKNG